MTKPIKNNSQLLYLQARQLFEQARTRFEDGTIKSEPKLVEAVFNSFQEFFTSMGKPNIVPRYAPEQGPPWSEDYNSMMTEIRMDLELLFQELDILGRSIYTDFNHNMIQQEIIRKQFEDVLDKMRDLESYAGIGGTGVDIGRDDFLNKDKIDYARISGTPLEIVDGAVTLPQTSRINVAQNAKVTIVAGNRKGNSFIIGAESNGFPGNNTEIHSVTDDVLTNKNYIPTFLGEENNHSDYASVLDGNPNTWFEYEKVNVREHDKIRVAKNLGWDYQVYENQTVMWAEDPEDGILKLHVQIILNKEETINQINCNMYTPPNYGAKTAIVKNILVSNGKDAPFSVLPKNRTNDQYQFHFQPVKAKVVSIIFEQRHKYITDIGHIFYEKKMQVEDNAEYAMDMATKKYKYAPRVEGPLVSLEDLGISVKVSEKNVEANYPLMQSGGTITSSIGETINRLMGGVDMDTVDMGVEKFEGFRWCIGIRDIEIFSSEYATEGELVTHPFYFDKPLDKISLNVNENIPSAFTASDAMKYDWLKYYVSIDDGAMWHAITPMSHEVISDDQPPKIYTVRNIETSEQELDYKRAYIESEYPVYSLRMKIVARRPEDYTLEGFTIKDQAGSVGTFTQTSPIVNSYIFNIATVNEAMNSEESDRMVADLGQIGDSPDGGFDPTDPTIPDEDWDGMPPGTGGDNPWDDDDGDGIPNWDDPDHPDYVPDPPDGWQPPGNPGTYPGYPPGGGGGKPPTGGVNPPWTGGGPNDDDDGDGTPNHEDPDWRPPLTVKMDCKKTEWCMHTELKVEGSVYSGNTLSRVELYVNNELKGTQTLSGRYATYKFTLPANTFNPSTITVVVKAFDAKGSAVDTDVLNIIDCTDIPPEDQPQDCLDMSKLSVVIDRKISKLCECDSVTFYGSVQGPNPIQSLLFRVNGTVVDPNNLGTPPANDPCVSGGETSPSPNPTPNPEPEPTPVPTIDEPSIPMEFFKSNTSSADTVYWTGKRDMPATVVNGYNFNPRDPFWEGRNDWLDLINHITGGSPVFALAKIDTTNVFWKHLYDFILKVKQGGVTLPEPFSKFDTWCNANLPSLSKAQRGTIYASYKFKKPAIIHESGLKYLKDGVLDTMAKYMNDPKLKSFSYHWIDFADIKPDAGTLAWVLDIPALPAFLSYMNFEETAMDAGIGNMKAIRPIDYTISAGQGFNDGMGTLNEGVLKNYYLATDDFTAQDDYFTVQSMSTDILGVYAAMESAIHEAGHAISNYGTEAYKTATNHKYTADAGKALHDYLEWYEISGWDAVSTTQDGTSKFTKSSVGFTLSNGKEAPVSTYGCTSPAEDFADAFDFYVMNPKLLRERYPKKWAFMEKFVKNMPSYEVTPFSYIKDMPNEIQVEVHYKKQGHREVEAYADFGEWLEEFERREDCGCKNKKKTVEPMFRIQSTPFSMMASGNEQSFHVTLPYWKLRELGAVVGQPTTIEVSAIDTINDEALDSMTFMIEDCDKPPVDEDGNERVRDCWLLESVEVHYYNHESHSIESKAIPVNALPYTGINNGAGSEVTVGWRTQEKAPILMLTSGNDDSGYAFQIHAVGLNYLNEYDQPESVWTVGIGMKTPAIKNENKMIGDPSRAASWTTDMENGDYSTSPSLGQRTDYVTYIMSNEWIEKACQVNAPNFNPDDYIEEEEDKVKLYDCNELTHIVFQVYDEQSRQLKIYKIDVSAEGKDTYNIPTKNGNVVVTVGWVNYFKGPVIQIKQATGTDNILLTAMGAVYRDVYGDSQTAWSTQLRYKTNGVQYPEFVIGEKKDLSQIPWVQNGVVNYAQATFVGRQGDMVAYLVDELFTTEMCEPEKPVDADVGIDPDNPPDVPRVDFINIFDTTVCIDEGMMDFEAVASDDVGLKEVEYGIYLNGVPLLGPHTDSVSGLKHNISAQLNTDTLVEGDTIRFYVRATNLFGVSSIKSVDLVAENCDTEPPTVLLSTTLTPNGSGKYCYSHLQSGNAPIILQIQDDKQVASWEGTSSSGWSGEGNILAEQTDVITDTGAIPLDIPVTNPASIPGQGANYIPDSTFTVTVKGYDKSGKSTTQTLTLTFTDCEYVPIPEVPCGTMTEGGSGPATYYYNLGATAGQVTITYDFYGAQDNMDVYYKDQLLASTGNTTNTGSLTFNYNPTDETKIKVVMNDGQTGSAWEYVVGCPVPSTPPSSGGSDEGAITNDYKVLARLKWGGSPADMDFYAYVDRNINKRVAYGQKTYTDSDGSMYLNYDWTGHDDDADYNTEYEVITINGFANKQITFIVNRYTTNGLIDASHPPVVEIVREDTGAVVHTVTMPASDWTTDFVRAVEIKLDANGNYASVVRGKATISSNDPNL